MANYRKITDVEVLAEASESTNVLVEENGALKKMAMANMGGGNGSVAFIKWRESDDFPNGPYDFINPEDFSVIEPATNSKVRQAIENGIVYHVIDNSESNDYFASPILMAYLSEDPNQNEYVVYAFTGCGSSMMHFSIYDE